MPRDSAIPDGVETAPAYPGSEASAADLLALADTYRDAAGALFDQARGKGLHAHVPGRLCALQAIELYRNAWLLNCGTPPEKIRARRHALDEDTFAEALCLRVGTRRHLRSITETREYLVARYAPGLFKTQSEITRVVATLQEVGNKTRRLLGS